MVANNLASDYDSEYELQPVQCNIVKSVDSVLNQDLSIKDDINSEDDELINTQLSREGYYCNYFVDILACNLGAEPRFSYS